MAVGQPTGSALASGTTDGDTLPVASTYESREVTLGAGYELQSGTKYAIEVEASGGTLGNDDIKWVTANTGYADGSSWGSLNSGSTWTEDASWDNWFQTKAGAVVKDSFTPADTTQDDFSGTTWRATTFTASSTYTITSVVLRLARWVVFAAPGTITVSIKAVDSGAPGKATNPSPTDNQEDISIAGRLALTTLAWSAPSGETPDYLVYFRAEGGSWVLQETITDDSTSHTVSSAIRASLGYYSVYEWRVDTRENAVTTTGDTWTFVSEVSPQFTDYTRKSDYDADKVWQPGVGWVAPNTFEFAGGGQYKERVVVVGHNVIYYGDV